MMPHYFYSDRMVAPGNATGAAEVRARAEARIAEHMDQLDARLADRPWMMGDRYSALDPYTFMLARWTRGMHRPARSLPHLGPFLQRMLERPAVQATLAAEGLQAPFV
jgi:glutathione S-transferase